MFKISTPLPAGIGIAMLSLIVWSSTPPEAGPKGGDAGAQAALEDVSGEQMVMKNLSAMPLAFTENQGQFGEGTLFKANSFGATFYFCADETAYLFVRNTDELLDDNLEGWHAFPKDKSYGSVGHAQVFDQSIPPARVDRGGSTPRQYLFGLVTKLHKGVDVRKRPRYGVTPEILLCKIGIHVFSGYVLGGHSSGIGE